MFRPGDAGITEVITKMNCMWEQGLFNRGREPSSKPENILIGVIQRHRCNSKSIRLAPIAHDAFTIQLVGREWKAVTRDDLFREV